MPGQEKFPRRERLTRQREFEDVYQHGKKAVGREFVCYVVRREGQGRKLGVAVSRKVGGAVVRNRIKRYVREAYRSRRKHMVEGFSMVVVARQPAAALSYQECSEALGRLFRQGEVLSG